MTQLIMPSIWLIVLIAGLPQLSESVYTPSLPDIARALSTSEPMVEYTLTIYLFGFAIGTLFWGKISDQFGRKPCVIAGLIIFILGCIGCYFSYSIELLMLNRFIQAFGGSTGSVLAQAICRDAFQGQALGKVYSSIGASLAIFPALGPVVGGVIAENYGWSNIFVFLILFALIIIIFVSAKLPETHRPEIRKPIPIKEVSYKLLKDKRALGYGLIVAACNGISFSYYAEGSFYLIKLLGMSTSGYGLSFLAIAGSSMLSGIISRNLQRYKSLDSIMTYGITIVIISTSLFSILISLHLLIDLPTFLLIRITIGCQMLNMLGFGLANSNALALALVDYKWCIGAASSLFGFFYYCIISLFTLGMGFLHNGTLLPMPFYFLSISIFMYFAQKKLIQK